VSQREVLEHQGALGPDPAEEAGEDEGDHAGHHRSGRPEFNVDEADGVSGGDRYKKAFSYALARLDRTVEPAHHNYQIRPKAYLESKDVDAQWELDYTDVRFHVGDTLFMGEIKVTGWLRLGEAFRVALGQLLDYGDLHHCQHLVMFLDQPLDSRRLELASSLTVVLVCQSGEKYTLTNPSVAPELSAIFS
jgi:hypothetical protein